MSDDNDNEIIVEPSADFSKMYKDPEAAIAKKEPEVLVAEIVEMNDDQKPWGRIKGETDKVHKYFQLWLEMAHTASPMTRTLPNMMKVLKKYGIPLKDRVVRNHIKNHNWVERAKAYDKYVSTLKLDGIHSIVPMEALAMLETAAKARKLADLALGDMLTTATQEGASFLSINDIAKLLKLSNETNKNAIDIATIVKGDATEKEGSQTMSNWIKLVEDLNKIRKKR